MSHGDMMNIVFSDFEGTLKCDKKISLFELKTLNDFLVCNKIVILTDSKIAEVKEYVDSYNLKIDIFSTYEGIYYQDGMQKKTTISKYIIEAFNDYFKDSIYTAYGEGDEGGYVYKYIENIKSLYPKTQKRLHDLHYYVIAVDLTKKQDLIDFVKKSGLSSEIIGEDAKVSLMKIKNNFIKKVEVVKYYKNKYPKAHTYGIGDSALDYEFISQCEVKVAMKNASEELKSKVDMITSKANNESGFVDFLDNISKLK